jgi:hypothetical protein
MDSTASAQISPLVLADRLIALAEDAERAGLRKAAGRIIRLAERVCEERPRPHWAG